MSINRAGISQEFKDISHKEPEQIDIYLGKRLRHRRRLLGFTQLQLATACNIRFQQIQKYECGGNRISAGRLFQLAEALETSVGYFYEGYSKDTPNQKLDVSRQSDASELFTRDLQILQKNADYVEAHEKHIIGSITKAVELRARPKTFEIV